MKVNIIYKIFIITILVSLLFTLKLQSEGKGNIDSTYHVGGWFTMGIGMCRFGPTGYLNFSFAYNDNIFTIRWLDADESRFSFVEGVKDFPRLSMKEKGILYGRSYREEFLFMSISGGIGFISWIDRGKKITEYKYETIDISTYGIPFEARFRFDIGFLGIGGAWFGNINSQKFLSGGIIELSIGVF
jgi:hypothetical protein